MQTVRTLAVLAGLILAGCTPVKKQVPRELQAEAVAFYLQVYSDLEKAKPSIYAHEARQNSMQAQAVTLALYGVVVVTELESEVAP